MFLTPDTLLPLDPLDKSEAIEYLTARDKGFGPLHRIVAVDYLESVELMNDVAIAKSAGISASKVRHIRRIGKKLSPEVNELMSKGSLSLEHAKHLATLPLDKQEPVARTAIAHHWPVTKLRKHVRTNTEYVDEEQARDYQFLSRQISEKLGFPVKVKPVAGEGKKGVMQIEYYGLDDFDNLCARIGVVIPRE